MHSLELFPFFSEYCDAARAFACEVLLAGKYSSYHKEKDKVPNVSRF